MKKKHEVNLRETLCSNGKYYVKLNGEYIGTYTEEELRMVKNQINNWSSNGKSVEYIIDVLRTGNINKEKGDAISKGMKESRLKQYNKKLPISTINQIKHLSKEYGVTENEIIIKVVNEFSS